MDDIKKHVQRKKCPTSEEIYYFRYYYFKSIIIDMINKYKNEGYKLFIYGAGKKGMVFLRVISELGYKIDGIIDFDNSKLGNKLMDYIIKDISFAIKQKSVVFIMNRNYYSFIKNEFANYLNNEIKLINLEVALCKK